jgi:hypothetical protein
MKNPSRIHAAFGGEPCHADGDCVDPFLDARKEDVIEAKLAHLLKIQFDVPIFMLSLIGNACAHSMTPWVIPPKVILIEHSSINQGTR